MDVLRRGVSMLRALNAQAHALGPALLRTTGEVEEGGMDELPESVTRQLCSHTRDNLARWRADGISVPFGIRYLMDHVEYLAGGTIDEPAMPRLTRGELDHCAFTLMWYLYVAGAEFGFRHGDLKAGNVAFRVHKQPQTHQFVLRAPGGDGGGTVYVFSSAIDAVVIDLDLGRMSTTRAGFDHGTYYAAPPETLAWAAAHADAFGMAGGVDTVAYDWWAVGIVVLEMHCMPRYHGCDAALPAMRASVGHKGIWLEPFMDDGGLCASMAAGVMASGTGTALFGGRSRGALARARAQLMFMYAAALVIAAVHQNDALLLPTAAAMQAAPAFKRLFTAAFSGAAVHSDAYRAFYTYVGTRVPEDVLELLRYLLNWDPAVRHRQHRPYLHLGLPLFANYAPRAYQYTYAADARDLDLTRDPDRLKRLRRYPDVEAALVGLSAAAAAK